MGGKENIYIEREREYSHREGKRIFTYIDREREYSHKREREYLL